MNKTAKKVLCDDDVFCPVCRCILIKPVTSPCNHSVCLECFDNTLQENALQCVKCQKRFASWVRNARKKNTLVNEKFWAQIQAQYPVEVEKRLRGEDDGLEERIVGTPSVKICEQGEVGKEFKQQLEKLQEQERKKKEKEELENAELAKKLQQEEEERAAAERREKQILALRDMELALKLAAETSQATPNGSVVLDGIAGCSTPKQRSLRDSTPKQGSSRDATPRQRIGAKKAKNRLSFLNNTSLPTGSPTWVQDKIVGPLDSFVRSLEKKNTSNIRNDFDNLDSTVLVAEQFKLVDQNPALLRPITDYMKLYYSEPSCKETSSISGSSNDEPNHFRPIRPSPLTPTKDTSTTVRTVKPSVCRSFFAETNSDSPSSKPNSSAPLHFATSAEGAFAPTCSGNKRNSVTEDLNDSYDSVTDFEDNSSENESFHQVATSASASALKQLEDDIVLSYCSSGGEDLNSTLVKKPTNRLQSAENQLNKISFSPFTTEKREHQINSDYELARKLQKDFDKQREKENLAYRQSLVNTYELRKRPEKPTMGNSCKKRKLSENSKDSAKQQTLDAFKFKSSQYQ